MPKHLPLALLITALFSLSTSALTAHNKNCASYHPQQVSNWQKSDHAQAIATVNRQSVLGDFNNAKVEHHSQNAKFYSEGENFKIDFEEQGGQRWYPVYANEDIKPAD